MIWYHFLTCWWFDDFLHHTGDYHFKKDIIQPLIKKFVAGKLDEGSFNYVGFQIIQDNQVITVSQSHMFKTLTK